MWLGWRVLQQPGACLLHAGRATLLHVSNSFAQFCRFSSISVTFLISVSGSRSAGGRSQQSLLSPLDKSEQSGRQSGAGWPDRGDCRVVQLRHRCIYQYSKTFLNVPTSAFKLLRKYYKWANGHLINALHLKLSISSTKIFADSCISAA